MRILAANGGLLRTPTLTRGAEIMEGTRRSTMDELAAAAVEADKVLVF